MSGNDSRRAGPGGGGARRRLLVAGMLLIAVNLRPALASVGPLVEDIRAATGLSHAALGLLTTIPLLGFGALSTFTPLVTRRLGISGALTLALVLLCAGTGLRAVPSVALLYAGTVLLGVGIALGNVLLPALVKRDFAGRSGGMTSLYSSVMGLGATIAAGMSVPIALEIGWRGALGVWAAPATLALVVWLPQLRRDGGRAAATGAARGTLRSLGRSVLAWDIALFMGFQSLTFYVVLAWLPDLLQSRGLDATEAGWQLALSQAAGILGTAAVPLWASRLANQRAIVWTLGALEAISLTGLFFAAAAPALVSLLVSILGFALGGTFGLALLLLVLRSAHTEAATALSGMAQSVGYLIAAAGPAVFGLLYDVTAGWAVPLVFLVLVLIAKVVVGVRAGRPGEVGVAA